MASSTLIPFLKKSSLFAGCEDSVLNQLAASCHLRDLTPGQDLFLENEDATSFFMVKSGTIGIRKSSRSGDEELAQIGPDSALGEMSLLHGPSDHRYLKRTAAAVAQEPCQLVEIPFVQLETLLNANPKFGMCFYRNLARNLSGRISKTAEDLTSLKSLHLKHI